VSLLAVGLAAIRPLLRIFFPGFFSNLAIPEISTIETIQSLGTTDSDCLPPTATCPTIPGIPLLSPLPPVPSSYVPIFLNPEFQTKRPKSWKRAAGATQMSELTITTVKSTDTRRTSQGHGHIIIVNETEVATTFEITRPDRTDIVERDIPE
jgi:hypothetical protein